MRDWQIELNEKHTNWLERGFASLSVGDGWADLMQRLFDRIAAEMATLPAGGRLSIDAKEKYGHLDVSWFGPLSEEADLAIGRHVLRAEMRSACTCDICGEAGRLRSTRPSGGWLAVRCEGHADNLGVVLDEQPRRWGFQDASGRYEAVYDRRRDTVRLTPVTDGEGSAQ